MRAHRCLLRTARCQKNGKTHSETSSARSSEDVSARLWRERMDSPCGGLFAAGRESLGDKERLPCRRPQAVGLWKTSSASSIVNLSRSDSRKKFRCPTTHWKFKTTSSSWKFETRQFRRPQCTTCFVVDLMSLRDRSSIATSVPSVKSSHDFTDEDCQISQQRRSVYPNKCAGRL